MNGIRSGVSGFETDENSTTRSKDSLSFNLKSHAPLLALFAIAVTGLCVSAYMTWVGLTGSSVVGCDGGVFNCDHVLTSRWSKIFGMPVGLPATALYGLLIGLLGFATFSATQQESDGTQSAGVSPPGPPIWQTLSLLSWIAALAALWFIGLQVFVLGHICLYCLVAHGCSLATWALVHFAMPIKRSSQMKNASIALGTILILIVGQSFAEPPQTFRIEEHAPIVDDAGGESGDGTTTTGGLVPNEVDGGSTEDLFEAPSTDTPVFEAPVLDAPESQSMLTSPIFSIIGVVAFPDGNEETGNDRQAETRRLVPVSGGRRKLDLQQWPLWGDADAKYVIAKMFDYTCSHCRATHVAIREAAKQLDGQLAVVALPVPLHQSCNSASTTSDPALASRCDIAKVVVAMWLSDRSKFTAYHDWMMAQERSVAEARQHAIELVGADVFNARYNSPTPAAYIDKDVFLYKEAGAGTLPKLVFPQSTVVGEMTSGSTLANLVREKLK